MKKVYIGVYTLIVVIFLKFVITFTINEISINLYDNANYNTILVKSLLVFNFSESYVAHYNYGNFLYKLEDYAKAIREYENAIKKDVPKDKVCSVRINLSLAKVKNINSSLSSSFQLSLLKQARKVLYEDGCAHENDDEGNSKKAEELEKKIKELELELSQSSNNDPTGGDDDGKDSDDDPKEGSKEKEIKERNESARKDRKDKLDRDEDMDGYHYYDGKKW